MVTFPFYYTIPALIYALAFCPVSTSFSVVGYGPTRATITLLARTTTLEPETDTETRTRRGKQLDRSDGEDDEFNDSDDDLGSLEYLMDPMESREMEDPFHILLLGSTFEKPKITVNYVSGSLEYVLDMPHDEARELTQFAYSEGMSCLGTWPREECLVLGKKLQRRDIVCRVVPYCEGGQRGWQAKDASGKVANSGYSGV